MKLLEDVRLKSTSLRDVLKPFMKQNDAELIIAPRPDFIALNGLKLYIIQSNEFTAEDLVIKCPKCQKYHKGFGVLTQDRKDDQYYFAFQFDDCNKDIHLAFLGDLLHGSN